MSDLLIIGHRGALSLAPENTLPAFLLAAKSGAQMVELDVQFSKDRMVVAIHDETLERTTNGTGPVREKTLEQLKTLSAGSKFSPEFNNARIPSLEEVFKSLPPQIGLNIEIKTDLFDYPGIESKVLGIINQFHARQRVIISSFNWASLASLHRLDPKLRLGLLFNRLTPDLWRQASLLNVYSLHPPVNLVTGQFIWQAHSWGYRMYPWVVNTKKLMLKLKSMGVDGIFTDCPQLF